MDHGSTLLPSPSRRRLIGGALALSAGAAVCTTARAAIGSGTAPDFTLRTTAGGNLRLQEQRGRVVMVNFWATWCGPCKIEMPHLVRLYEKYRASGFQLLGVNIDDDPRNAVAGAAKLGITFPVLLDAEKRVARLYDLSTMPTTLLIDRDGTLRHVHRGYRDGYEITYDQQVRELLKA
ncbi:MAG: peroxiredoxin family protein [Piscinibacter sp.]|uniref:peroxiredoxin family protein n=1 Tax=Piscinibacter sp. TaxID=1903157 RepID=UPI003D1165FC